jgi:hypothetical protein
MSSWTTTVDFWITGGLFFYTRDLVDLGYKLGANAESWKVGAPQIHLLSE